MKSPFRKIISLKDEDKKLAVVTIERRLVKYVLLGIIVYGASFLLFSLNRIGAFGGEERMDPVEAWINAQNSIIKGVISVITGNWDAGDC